MVKMGDVWDRTAEFLSDNIAAILPVALLAFFVPASISGNFAAAREGAGLGLEAGLLLAQLALAILSVWGTIAITVMALDDAGSEGVGRTALRRLPAALVLAVTGFVVAIVALLPIPLVLGANGVDMTALAEGRDAAMGSGPATFVALYVLALAAIGIWLMARLIVVNPVLVREGRWLSAYTQSWKLTRGVTWRIIGVILLFALVAWVSWLAAQTVFGSVFALVAGEMDDGVSLAGVLTSIVVAAVQTAFMVLGAAFVAKLYLALTARVGLRGSAAAA